MRDYKLYCSDILASISKIQKYTRGFTLEKFRNNTLVSDAVIRNLEIIGESAKKLPDAVKSSHPDIEWKKIAGMRDILIHEYFGVDYEIVWDIVKEKLPELKKSLKKSA